MFFLVVVGPGVDANQPVHEKFPGISDIFSGSGFGGLLSVVGRRSNILLVAEILHHRGGAYHLYHYRWFEQLTMVLLAM